ncbi:MAG: T9SS type A sorting domain-containing protein [bacterium]
MRRMILICGLVFLCSITFAFSWTEPVQLFPDTSGILNITLIPFSGGDALIVGFRYFYVADSLWGKGFYFREWTDIGLGVIDSVVYEIDPFDAFDYDEIYAFQLQDSSLWFLLPGYIDGFGVKYEDHTWIETTPQTHSFSNTFVAGPDTTVWAFSTDGWHNFYKSRWNGVAWEPLEVIGTLITDMNARTQNDSLVLWTQKVLESYYPDSMFLGLLKNAYNESEWGQPETILTVMNRDGDYRFYQGKIDSIIYWTQFCSYPTPYLVYYVVSGENTYSTRFDSLNDEFADFVMDSTGGVWSIRKVLDPYSSTSFIKIAEGRDDGWIDLTDSITTPGINPSVTNAKGFCNPLYSGPAYITWKGEDRFWGVRREPDLISEKELQPERITLSAYPNPFNSAVTITVSGEATSPVQIEIYDVAGRKIVESPPAPLIKWGAECNEAGGSYIWQPDVSLPSGVYLVRAAVGETSIAKRVVYLK